MMRPDGEGLAVGSRGKRAGDEMHQFSPTEYDVQWRHYVHRSSNPLAQPHRGTRLPFPVCPNHVSPRSPTRPQTFSTFHLPSRGVSASFGHLMSSISFLPSPAPDSGQFCSSSFFRLLSLVVQTIPPAPGCSPTTARQPTMCAVFHLAFSEPPAALCSPRMLVQSPPRRCLPLPGLVQLSLPIGH